MVDVKPWKQAAKAKRMRDAGTRAIEAAKRSRKHDKPHCVDVERVLCVVQRVVRP